MGGARFLCHGALIGLSKVYYFGIPEDSLRAGSVVPALFVFFREYVAERSGRPGKPAPRVLNALLALLGTIIALCIVATLLHQFDLFTEL